MQSGIRTGGNCRQTVTFFFFHDENDNNYVLKFLSIQEFLDFSKMARRTVENINGFVMVRFDDALFLFQIIRFHIFFDFQARQPAKPSSLKKSTTLLSRPKSVTFNESGEKKSTIPESKTVNPSTMTKKSQYTIRRTYLWFTKPNLLNIIIRMFLE